MVQIPFGTVAASETKPGVVEVKSVSVVAPAVELMAAIDTTPAPRPIVTARDNRIAFSGLRAQLDERVLRE
jgi:hypothetical protein